MSEHIKTAIEQLKGKKILLTILIVFWITLFYIFVIHDAVVRSYIWWYNTFIAGPPT